MSKSWAGGSTRHWRQVVRPYVLRRDGWRCQLGHEGCTTVAEHVHHLDGKEYGDDPDRCVAACAHCNLKEGRPGGDPAPRRCTAW